MLLLPQLDTGWPKLPAWHAPTQVPPTCTWLQSAHVLLVMIASVEGLQTAGQRQQERETRGHGQSVCHTQHFASYEHRG